MKATGTLALPPICTNVVCNAGTQSTSTTQYGSASIGSYKSIDSVYTGRFKPGEIRLNPVVIKTGGGSVTGGLEKVVNKTSSTTWRTTEGPWITHQGWQWPVWDANLARFTSAKAEAKLNSAELDVGMMLAELGETIGFLRNPIKSLTDFLKGPSSLKRGIDAAGGSWLTYQYGFKPLVNDINDTIEHINNFIIKAPRKLWKKKGRFTSETTSTLTLPNGSPLTRCSVQSVRKTVTAGTSNVYYQLLLEAACRTEAKMYGLDLSQALGLGWELIPYSFVVDWFVNVGDWLKAISPASHANVVGRCTSQHVTYTVKNSLVGDFRPIDYVNYNLMQIVPPVYQWTCNWYERRVDPAMPVMPAFSPRTLGLERSITGIALLWQQLGPLLMKR